MKYLSIVIFSLLLLSFRAGISHPPKYFYYVDPFKEQEIKLTLRDDLTFSMIDDFGRNKFSYTGKYRYWGEESRFMIFYDIKTQIQAIRGGQPIFDLKSGDTVVLLNDERLYIHEEPFFAAADSNTDLLEVKYQLLKAHYTKILGPKEFLKRFGDGDEAVAKKNLVYPFAGCSLANASIGVQPPDAHILIPPAVNVSIPAMQSSAPQRTSLSDL